MLDAMLDPALLAPERVRGLRRDEYEKLVELGVFEDERVELLRGVLVEMSPQGDTHSRVAAWIAQRFGAKLSFARFDVRSHSPYAASDDSMPEPDVSVSRRVPRLGHPDRALLLVEVSGSSLIKDRGIKTEIYADAGVPEYWIVNVQTRQVEVLTHPTHSGYQRSSVREMGDVLRPLKLRGFSLRIDDIPFGPAPRKRRSR
jgi:Uma2 family endonuclease